MFLYLDIIWALGLGIIWALFGHYLGTRLGSVVEAYSGLHRAYVFRCNGEDGFTLIRVVAAAKSSGCSGGE